VVESIDLAVMNEKKVPKRPKAPLTAAAVRTTTLPGRYRDGRGLYLDIAKGGSKAWVFRYMRHSRARELGLGRADHDGRSGGVTLAEARIKAGEAHALLARGIDPIDARRAAEETARAEAQRRAGATTFEAVARQFYEAKCPAWKSDTYKESWIGSLVIHVFPLIGAKDVAHIGLDDVLAVLQPLWLTITDTAAKIRQRIEVVLDYAKARGLRSGENPALWRSSLRHLLAAPSAVRKARGERHHPSLAWREVPAFWSALRERDGLGAEALRLTILTAARTAMILEAPWVEIDLDGHLWVCPAPRMKESKEHVMPLTDAALAILYRAARLRCTASAGEYVFPGQPQRDPGRKRRARRDAAGAAASVHLSENTMAAVIRRMNEVAARNQPPGSPPRWRDPKTGETVVPHGFRSTFRTFATEAARARPDAGEMALAHAVGGEIERIYNRAELLDSRRDLFEAWAHYLETGVVKTVGEIEGERLRRAACVVAA